jgi:hypothetical protein
MITYSIRVPLPYIRGNILPWLKENQIDALYDWPYSEFTFYNEEDALMFHLKFGGKRIKTKLEQLIEQAKDD